MRTPAASSSEMPYQCTAVFDENTLPVGLRREHRTKPGGVIRVLEGRLRYFDPASEVILEFGRPGLVLLACLTSSSRLDRCGCRSNSTISCPIFSAMPSNVAVRRIGTGGTQDRYAALSSMSTSRTASKASPLPATSRAGRTGLPVSESASNIGSSPSARARQRRTTSSPARTLGLRAMSNSNGHDQE